MAGDPEMAHLNRTLKEISHSLKAQNRVLETLNANLVTLIDRLTQPEEANDASSV